MRAGPQRPSAVRRPGRAWPASASLRSCQLRWRPGAAPRRRRVSVCAARRASAPGRRGLRQAPREPARSRPSRPRFPFPDDGCDGRGGGDDFRGDGRTGERRLDPGEQRPDVAERGEAPPRGRRLLVQELRERPAAAEDQRLGVGERDAELLRHLLVGETAPVAQQDRLTLLLGQASERVLEPDQLLAAAAARRRPLEVDGVGDELEAAAARSRLAARKADVASDPEQPGELDGRDDAPPQPAHGVQERRLDGVLGVLAPAEPGEAVGEDAARVVLVERAHGVCVRADGERLEAGRATDGADCCQLGSPRKLPGRLRRCLQEAFPSAADRCTPSIE